MTETSHSQVNLGGIWLFNPPEPCGHTTDLRGVANDLVGAGIEPAGGCHCVPDVWQLEVDGSSSDPTTARLFGTHYLKRRTPHLRRSLVGYRLGWWATDPVDLLEDGGDYYAWTLMFGRIDLLAGPYIDGFDFGPAWWLVAWLAEYEFGGGSYGQTADYVYQFDHPEADDGAQATITEGATSGDLLSQKLLFDGLSGNVFKYAPPAGGLESGAPGGNVYLTARPFYP